MARKIKKGSKGRIGALRRANARDEASFLRKKLRRKKGR